MTWPPAVRLLVAAQAVAFGGLFLVVQVVWLAVSVVGLVLALEALDVAQADCAAIAAEQDRRRPLERRDRSHEWELERALAAGDVESARWIVGTEALFVLAGAASFLMPPQHRTPAQWLIVALLVSGALLLPVRLYQQRARRRRLLELDA